MLYGADHLQHEGFEAVLSGQIHRQRPNTGQRGDHEQSRAPSQTLPRSSLHGNNPYDATESAHPGPHQHDRSMLQQETRNMGKIGFIFWPQA